jgi:hypothetical protein
MTFDRIKRTLLQEHGFTNGMVHHLEHATAGTSLRIWILDNSASTNQVDCCKYIDTHEMRRDKCTRWEDIMDTAMYHAQMATWLHTPTIFRLLNTCPGVASEYTIASQPYSSDISAKQHLHRFQQWLQSAWPTGRTSLTHHVQQIRQSIQSMQETLHSKTQHIVLTIATDGLPSDENGVCNDEQCELFRKSFRTLSKLPIQVIFRLNTNHSGVKKASFIESIHTYIINVYNFILIHYTHIIIIASSYSFTQNSSVM